MLRLVHIPDGFLSATVVGVTWAGAAVSVASALGAERRDPVPVPAGLLGSMAAFLFAAQMVNVPVAPGTSGHLVGATLAAVIIGPWRTVLVMAVVLGVQALLFQDGGISAFGANLLDMGVAASLVGYTIASTAGRLLPGRRGIAAGGVLGAFAGTLSAATLTAVWLSVSGLYPARVLLPVMLLTHVPIGLLEGALTGGILVTILRWRPDLIDGLSAGGGVRHHGAVGLGMLGLALAVAAFVSPFASMLPDGLDRTARTLGFAGEAVRSWHAPLAGFTLPGGLPLAMAPAVAGIVGTLAAAVIAWGVSRSLSAPDHASHR
jgi:cobalt/nickel transport system permease protein